MICEFCQYQHDNEGDRYGCPNCCGGEYDIDNQGQQCPASLPKIEK
jgi:Zn finger protein HypA/HybF involved in hydrogenase expression